MRKIYLASSWRNPEQPRVLAKLRSAGHEVYDFRNPAPGNAGFAWSAIDQNWQAWTPEQFRHCVTDPVAIEGYTFDKAGLDWADTCVILLPCGRSAHLEAGYAIGQGKPTVFYLSPDKFEPELMYLLGDGMVVNDDELLMRLAAAPVEDERTAAPSAALSREQIEHSKAFSENPLYRQLCDMALRYRDLLDAGPVAWRYQIIRGQYTYSDEHPNMELAGDAASKWNVTPLIVAPRGE